MNSKLGQVQSWTLRFEGKTVSVAVVALSKLVVPNLSRQVVLFMCHQVLLSLTLSSVHFLTESITREYDAWGGSLNEAFALLSGSKGGWVAEFSLERLGTKKLFVLLLVVPPALLIIVVLLKWSFLHRFFNFEVERDKAVRAIPKVTISTRNQEVWFLLKVDFRHWLLRELYTVVVAKSAWSVVQNLSEVITFLFGSRLLD